MIYRIELKDLKTQETVVFEDMYTPGRLFRGKKIYYNGIKYEVLWFKKVRVKEELYVSPKYLYIQQLAGDVLLGLNPKDDIWGDVLNEKEDLLDLFYNR